ncbi:MAG: hypothetical protein QXQ77_01350 [Candidatus Aenigmatarchaeota archaeon]
MMKGELSFVEYVISVGFFISFVAYIFFLLLRYYPIYLQEMESERKRLEAYQISELLINDPGEPANWDTLDSVKRLGFLDENKNKTNLLSLAKVNKMRDLMSNDFCAPNYGYEWVKSKIDSEFDFSLTLVNLNTREILISCFPPKVVITPTNITVRRIVVFSSGGYGELIIQVW